ncbi:MAG: 23S rRNA (adenine(2503)-C(2))-methyltransferase RlmN [Candidatus Omnitrophica bacterium]|nr:23S rRNA (adenine(2503)-C(2))-methyltransferase RlmN [Candidatus Omnitrophota bacterium]
MSKFLNILDLNYIELSGWLSDQGETAFRPGQIWDWIYRKSVRDFSGMTDLPAKLRQNLSAYFILGRPIAAQKFHSSDGTVKFLFAWPDGESVETALIPAGKRSTVCVSNQAGCKFGCQFCASGQPGFRRDLTAGEIIAQVLEANGTLPDRPVSHIVFMGMGEPLDNYDQVIKAARILNDRRGMNIAARRITISTCGIVPGIMRLADEGLQFELAVSLHASDDGLRDQLMPVNRRYPLNALLTACRAYCQKTNRQITFEYLLIKDLTCTSLAARQLARLFQGIIAKMNLIAYNPVVGFSYQTPEAAEVRMFQQELKRRGVHATLRASRGRDMPAACGQLRGGRLISAF